MAQRLSDNFFSLGGQLWCRKEPSIHVLSIYASPVHFLSHLETKLLLDNNSTALMAQSLASTDSRANLLPRNSFGSRIRAPGCRYSDIPSSDRIEIPAPNHLLGKWGRSFRRRLSPFYHCVLLTMSHTHCCFSPGGHPPALGISFCLPP